MFTLEHPKLAALNAEYVRSAVAAAPDEADIVETIGEQKAREITFKGLPRSKQ